MFENKDNLIFKPSKINNRSTCGDKTQGSLSTNISRYSKPSGTTGTTFGGGSGLKFSKKKNSNSVSMTASKSNKAKK